MNVCSSVNLFIDVNGVEPAPLSDPMLVDHAGPVEATSEGEPMEKPAESSDSQSDSQNPQSLPSPPPELTKVVGTDEQTIGLSASDKEVVSAPEESPAGQPPNGKMVAAAPMQERQESPVVHGTSTVTSPPPPALPARTGAGLSGNGRKLSSRDRRRKLKQLQKAGKLVDDATAAKPSEAVADVDGEEHYWDEADTIPDHVLMDDSGQQQAAVEGEHIQPDKAERAATPAHNSQAIQPDEPPADNNREVDVQECNDDPLEFLRAGCTSGFVCLFSSYSLHETHHARIGHIYPIQSAPECWATTHHRCCGICWSGHADQEAR